MVSFFSTHSLLWGSHRVGDECFLARAKMKPVECWYRSSSIVAAACGLLGEKWLDCMYSMHVYIHYEDWINPKSNNNGYYAHQIVSYTVQKVLEKIYYINDIMKNGHYCRAYNSIKCMES